MSDLYVKLSLDVEEEGATTITTSLIAQTYDGMTIYVDDDIYSSAYTGTWFATLDDPYLFPGFLEVASPGTLENPAQVLGYDTIYQTASVSAVTTNESETTSPAPMAQFAIFQTGTFVGYYYYPEYIWETIEVPSFFHISGPPGGYYPYITDSDFNDLDGDQIYAIKRGDSIYDVGESYGLDGQFIYLPTLANASNLGGTGVAYNFNNALLLGFGGFRIYGSDAPTNLDITNTFPIYNESFDIDTIDYENNNISITSTGTAEPIILTAGTSDVATGGTIAISSSGAITLTAGSLLIGTGTVQGTLTDSGTIEATGGLLTLNGPMSGTGVLAVDANGTLDITGSLSSAETITFLNDGILQLASPPTGSTPITVTGFAANDTIDFQNQENLTTYSLFGPGVDELLTYFGSVLVSTVNFFGIVDPTTIKPNLDGSGGTSLLVDPLIVTLSDPNPPGFNINWTFIHASEGYSLSPYVPLSGSSGGTIGYGVDLANGPLDEADFDTLFPGWRNNPDLAFLASLTAPNLVGAAAIAALGAGQTKNTTISGSPVVLSTSVSITPSQAAALTNLAETYTLNDLIEAWNKSSLVPISELPGYAQTALLDVAYQYGASSLASRTPRFWGLMQTAASTISLSMPNGSPAAWNAVINELEDFGDDYYSRRHSEAQLIQQIPGVGTAQPPQTPVQPIPIPNSTPTLIRQLQYQFQVTSGTQYALLPEYNDTGASSTDPTQTSSIATGLVASSPDSVRLDISSTGVVSPTATTTGTSEVFELISDPGTPSIASLTLPGEGASAFSIEYEVGTTWSEPQVEAPLSTINLPPDVTGLSVAPVDADGDPTSITSGLDFTFYLSFLTDGTYSGTITDSTLACFVSGTKIQTAHGRSLSNDSAPRTSFGQRRPLSARSCGSGIDVSAVETIGVQIRSGPSSSDKPHSVPECPAVTSACLPTTPCSSMAR